MSNGERPDAAACRQAEDLALVRKIRAGDSTAMGRLVDRYLPQLLAFFRYLRVPEASLEDMVQATFERLLLKLDSFEEDRKFSAWLMTVGRNLYFDECRRENRRRDFQPESMHEHVATPEEEVIVRHSAGELLAALAPSERFLVEMRVFQAMPFAEIAELTGDVEATLRSRFFRIMGKLRLEVEKNSSRA
ncbi:MAG TPA: sigma-70 family RNA polymerase sigma factor [Candidatus Rifleibacterium sp.]|nr:sigma-70 family RNA polymerase sigma factor [Candidatus Rifleibacterium sp.]HPW57378.1 sigma-70 family RNA polymerase sigma factor [Candidatus Rifleibacterium sp.]